MKTAAVGATGLVIVPNSISCKSFGHMAPNDKINVSLVNGYTRINQFDFEAFNEGTFLKDQVEAYKAFHGFYPELVQTDDIYMSRDNRTYLKQRGIRHTGRPLGRKPKKETRSRYQREKREKEKKRIFL